MAKQEPKMLISQTHYEHIHRTLVANFIVLQGLLFMFPEISSQLPTIEKNSADETATCIRILETECNYVGR